MQHLRTRNVLVAATILALACMIIVANARTPDDAANDQSTTASSGETHRSAERSLAAGDCRFAPGTRWAYDVTSTTRVDLDMRALAPIIGTDQGALTMTLPKVQEVQIRYGVEFEALAQFDDGASIVAGQIHDFHHAGENNVAMSDVDRPFMIRVAPRCGIEAFAWRFDAPDQAVRDQQSLISALNFWIAAERSVPYYKHAAFDFTGHYEGQYNKGRHGAVHGEVKEYTTVFSRSASQTPINMEVAHSSIDVTRGETPWFESLTNTKKLRMATSAEKIVVGTMEAKTRVQSVSPNDWRNAIADWRSETWRWGLLLETSTVLSTGRHVPEIPGIENLALADAIAQLEAMIAADPSNSLARMQFMIAFLRAHPEALPALVAMIQRGDMNNNNRLRALVFAAMGEANTPETRAALMGILDGEDFNYGNRIDAANALTKSHPVPEGYLDAILTFANDDDLNAFDRGFMTRAVGSFAKHQSDIDPQHAALARDSIKGWLDNAGTTDDQIIALQSAGNAGSDELLNHVTPYLNNSDHGVRRQAIRAMRGMSPDAVNPYLESAYGDADSRGVRLAALETAVKVSKHNKTPIPQSLVSTVISNLPNTNYQAEYNRMVDVIGTAARQGNTDAQAEIARQIQEEMAQDTKDIERLKSLGRYHNTVWNAPERSSN